MGVVIAIRQDRSLEQYRRSIWPVAGDEPAVHRIGFFGFIWYHFYYPKVDKVDWIIKLALMFELGGAVGNLIDRFNHGYVIDFVSVGNFPVFNVADSAITVGVIILLIGVWMQEKRERARLAASNLNQPDSGAIS